MDVYERAAHGEAIDTRNFAEFKDVLWPETERSRAICQKINAMVPDDERIRDLTDELLEGRLPKSARITPPFQIDRWHCVLVGERVMINEGL